jgi:hypothetical protein
MKRMSTEEVGILLRAKVMKCLLEWKTVSERIMTARFQGGVHNTGIIQCYAPTEQAEKHEKEIFFLTLGCHTFPHLGRKRKW